MALSREDIQGNILRGYRLPFANHVFLEILDAVAARLFLRKLGVTSDQPWAKRPETALNVGLSFAGLSRLGNYPELRSYAPAFAEGMPARAALLGDAPGDYAPFWSRSHIWISVYGQSKAALQTRLEGVLSSVPLGLRQVGMESAAALRRAQGNKEVWLEHFGFRDDISNPEVEGAEEPAKLGPGTGRRDTAHGPWLPIRTGEFLLGYENDAGDPLPPSALGKLLQNGTFAVVRKLEQRVHEFHDYLATTAKKFNLSPELLAEKLVGRRYDGSPLVDAPAEPTHNAFDYANDQVGRQCPLGAHVRRVHPRDAVGGDGTSGRHRLMRRGMPYGEAPGRGNSTDGAKECGLLFIGLNASIEDQFEFIQRDWINRGSRSAIEDDWDPLVGAHENKGKMVIPRDGLPLLLNDLPRFVNTKGGQYFFLPGLAGLRSLCE